MARVSKKPAAEPKPKPKLLLEKSAGAVVFAREAEIRYLLLRSRHWEFPKGLIDANESELDAAVREVGEETGLQITLVPGFRETVEYFYRRKESGAPVKKEVVYYLGEAKTTAYKISWEHQEARWVTLDEALELIEYTNAREILRRADEKIKTA